jgi:hypothetical protein
MKGLFDAEVFVDTVFSMESGAGSGNRFYLADYGSMHEFTTDCTAWFNSQSELASIRASAEFERDSTLPSACRKFEGEVAPEYVYTDWSGIPDYLISRTWICPTIFEIRDALQMLDGDSIERFPEWCRTSGHDITTEDPMMLVTRYQDYITPIYEPNTEISEPDDCYCAVTPLSLAELGIGPVDIFDDDYNG